MTVYLAGGLHSGWQKTVQKACPKLDCISPLDKDEGDMTLTEFGTWDLHHVKQADLVFTYIERTNPSAIGAAIETGYAAGQGTTVILVLEPAHKHFKDRYLDFYKKVADVTYETLEEGIQYLKTYESDA
jgi:nucleoside 2-deoxyribosyltransferase